MLVVINFWKSGTGGSWGCV